MTLGPIHWESYGGDYLEKVMAVFVAQDHPNVIRRTPASGDGGIDLMIPTADGYIAEQVKGFTGRLDDSRKRQIKDSWRTLQQNPRVNRPIVEWHLVVPIDPTPDEQAWFETLVRDAPYACEWRGEPQWNSFAAKHPHVVDYYFGGGRDRIVQRAKAMMSTVTDPSEPLSALDVAASFDMLRSALSRDDPHYRYDFLTTDHVLAPEELPPCALARSTSMSDGGYLTVCVVPKHLYAESDAPITGSYNVRILDEEMATKFEEHVKFGRAMEFPDGTLSATISAPGGLGGAFESGGGRIGPMIVQDAPKDWRIGIRNPDRKMLVEVPLKTITHTRGHGGAELVLGDASGTLEVTMLVEFEPEPTLNTRISGGGFGGKAVEAVLEVARFLAAAHPPNEIVWRPQYGARDIASDRIPAGLELMPAWLLRFYEDLAEIQQLADFPVTIPDDWTAEFIDELHTYVRLLRGEEVTSTWNDFRLELQPDADWNEFHEKVKNDGVFVHEAGVVVNLDGGSVELGRVQTVLRSARLADHTPGPDRRIRFVPGDDDSATRRLLPKPEAGKNSER